MKSPKVSVLIPIYGVEKYIERCARSLFEQTIDDIEYIFINDCTKDKSIDILTKVLKEYPTRIAQTKIINHVTNKGLPYARKTGINAATGQYIVHCDSDDWVDKTMYQKLYEKAVTDKSDIVVTGYTETDGSRIIKRSTHQFYDKNEYISNMLYMKESWAIWDKLCKRKLYENIEYPIYNMGEDMVVTFQLVLKAKKISIVNENLYNYFHNIESITKVRSEENRYNNWKQSVYNTQKVISILSIFRDGCNFKDEIEYIKYRQKKLAGNLAYNKRYAQEWINTFSSVNRTAYKLKKTLLIEKIKFYIIVAYSWVKSLL